MDMNKLSLIKWKGLTVFPENGKNLVVLECENGEQARDFFDVLLVNKFTFSIDYSNSEYPRLIIDFTGGVRFSILLAKDILSKYFANRQINLLTTGFDIGRQLACLDDRLEITHLHTFSLN